MILLAVALLILRFWNKNLKRVFVECRRNVSAAKSQQTNSKLEQIEFKVFAYLFKFIDQWAARNVAWAPNFLL